MVRRGWLTIVVMVQSLLVGERPGIYGGPVTSCIILTGEDQLEAVERQWCSG